MILRYLTGSGHLKKSLTSNISTRTGLRLEQLTLKYVSVVVNSSFVEIKFRLMLYVEINWWWESSILGNSKKYYEVFGKFECIIHLVQCFVDLINPIIIIRDTKHSLNRIFHQACWFTMKLVFKNRYCWISVHRKFVTIEFIIGFLLYCK